MLYIWAFVILVLVWAGYAALRRIELRALDDRRFIADNLPFLLAGINQVQRLHEKYCPALLSVTMELGSARVAYDLISSDFLPATGDASAGAHVLAGDLVGMRLTLERALNTVSGARQKVWAAMSQEDRDKEEFGDDQGSQK